MIMIVVGMVMVRCQVPLLKSEAFVELVIVRYDDLRDGDGSLSGPTFTVMWGTLSKR